ncbi:germinal-center associated nuclear protein-like isoform X2 [Oscarella lobularis]|uniref:germinal-center associated nuclear protein-like isoform X2 n=1 Tax=Oscarella lobularis TaxID=121494 RepID=UPI003313BB8F
MNPWPAVVGICSAMCADEEVRRRKAEKRRHVLERCTSGDIRMVKEYRRSAAGVDLCNSRHLRTIEALLMTSDYLIDNILDRKDVSWPVVYEFVADRFRSILQDITIQRLCCETTAGIVLRCLRFFIYAGYRLGTSWPGFQAKLNGDMIQQCISQLLFCYDGSSVHSCRCQNEWAEFAAIYLLYNLDSSEPCLYILSQPTKRRQHPLISLAFKIFLAKTTRNYVRFFRLVDQLPAACLSCAIHRHVKKFHRLALKVMNTGYSMKNCLYPLKVRRRSWGTLCRAWHRSQGRIGHLSERKLPRKLEKGSIIQVQFYR